MHQPSKLVRGVRPPLPAPFGGIPEWLKGADCKSAGTAFDGSNPSPTTISKTTHLKRGAFFCNDGEITAKAVYGTEWRGVESSGSTARSDVREDFALCAKPQGNPSPTTIYKNTDHCKRNGLFIFVNIKPAKALLHAPQVRFISATGKCFIRRRRAS